MKALIARLLVIGVLLLVAGGLHAEQPLPTEETPQTLVMDGTPLVPVPWLAQWLGGTTTTSLATGTITLTRGTDTLVAPINGTAATFNGQPLTLAAPALRVAGVPYLPLTGVATAFGMTATVSADGTQVTLTNPATGTTTNLPIRGRVLQTAADFDGDGTTETVYGAYLYYASPYNVWENGQSVSNPNLPLVWLTKGSLTLWAAGTRGIELAQLGANDLTGDGRPELWYTGLLPGADLTYTDFHAFTWRDGYMRNIIARPGGYLQYHSSGGLVIETNQQPPRMTVFNAEFGTPFSNGPVALVAETYTWDGTNFAFTRRQRTTGRYNGDAVGALRVQFGIPVTPESAATIQQGKVAIQ